MTDKQLEEYTRLKIAEATRDLQNKYDELKANAKEYKCTIPTAGEPYIHYYSIDDLTQELKDVSSHRDELRKMLENIGYQSCLAFNDDTFCLYGRSVKTLSKETIARFERVRKFCHDGLLYRLKKAFKGEL